MKKPTRALAFVLLVVLLASLIPVVWISTYNHPSADDYHFGALAARAFRETGSIGATIPAAMEESARTYRTWQGTYSAVFLFALQPAVFAEDLYFLSTLLLLLAFLLSIAYLARTILVDRFGSDGATAAVPILLFLLVSFQFVPDANQAFFWYNGSVYYTFFHSLAMVLTGAVLRHFVRQGGRIAALRAIPIVLLAAFLGGGNFSTALSLVLLLALFTLHGFLRRSVGRYWILATLLSSVTGMAISVLAPGNAARAAFLPDPQSPVRAVLVSFGYALRLIGQFTTLEVLAVLAFALPFLFLSIRRTAIRFRYPALFVALTFCLFAAQLTPPIYATTNIGAGRQFDLYYYTYLWMLFLDAGYVLGWAYRRYEESVREHPEADRSLRASLAGLSARHALAGTVLVGFLFLAGCLQYGPDAVRRIVSLDAAVSLLDGTAARYDREMDERVAIYEDPARRDVVVQKLTAVPHLFHTIDDVGEDPEYWTNQAVTRFYDKDSVVLAPEGR